MVLNHQKNTLSSFAFLHELADARTSWASNRKPDTARNTYALCSRAISQVNKKFLNESARVKRVPSRRRRDRRTRSCDALAVSLIKMNERTNWLILCECRIEPACMAFPLPRPPPSQCRLVIGVTNDHAPFLRHRHPRNIDATPLISYAKTSSSLSKTILETSTISRQRFVVHTRA